MFLIKILFKDGTLFRFPGIFLCSVCDREFWWKHIPNEINRNVDQPGWMEL